MKIENRIHKILGKLLANRVPRAGIVVVTDSVLVAEAPETRLLTPEERRSLIEQALRASPVNEGAAGMEGSAVRPDEIAAAGLRGLTVRVADGTDERDALAQARALVGEGVTVEKFPSLERFYTLRYDQEKPLLSEAWQQAQALRATGRFDYAEPNVAVPADGAVPSGAVDESVGPGPWDRDHPATRTDYEWSLKRINVKAMWGGASGSRGKGQTIGHIDTGYTLHPEVKPNLSVKRGHNYWENTDDALDPLDPSWGDRLRARFPVLNPGHGTGTGSVIVSPTGKQSATASQAWVSGTAPDAKLIPYRATPTVVIIPGGSQDEVARALVDASDAGADVISMSLGSPFGSEVLRQAVGHALDQGTVVCAAAGNIVAGWAQGHGVTYPAKYPGVVAVAGCDYDYAPWVCSCYGPEVTITAPGTDVWRAVATKDLPHAQVERGSGTSFAVATVAGVAACWVGRHGGRAALKRAFGGKPRLIPAAFLLALQRHRKISLRSGDPTLFGGGVIDASALAKVPLASVQEAEAALSMQTAQPESVAEPVLSAEDAFRNLTGAMPGQLPPGQMGRFAAALSLRPELLAKWWEAHAGASGQGDGGPRGTAPSKSRKTSYSDHPDDLVRSHFERIIANDPEVHAKARALAATPGLEGVAPAGEQPVLETIVLRTGRPVLLVENDAVPLDQPDITFWLERLQPAAAQEALRKVLPAVGRVEVGNYPLSWLGTGWLIDDDVIATNRHVAAEFGTRGGAGGTPFIFRRGLLDPSRPMSAQVDFKEEYGSAATREFKVAGILHIEDDDGPDLAFLKLERPDGRKAKLSSRLTLFSGQAARIKYVATVGYPAEDSRVPDQALVKRTFGDVYNVKRFAPGMILRASSDVVTHDCSTLGGNSGSPLFDLSTGEVVGLHAAGLYLQENRSIPAAVLKARLDAVRKGTVFPGVAVPAPEDPAKAPAIPAAAPQVAGGQTISFTLQVPVQLHVVLGRPSVDGGGAVPAVVAPDDPPAGSVAEAVARVEALVGRTRTGVLAVREGYAFRDGWITDQPAVVVVLEESAARARYALPESVGGFPVEVRDPGLADFAAAKADVLEELVATTYRKPSAFSLRPVTAPMKVLCHLSPDAGFPNLRTFLAGTTQRLTVGMYDFTAPHIRNAVRDAIRPSPRRLQLVLQAGESLGGTVKENDIPDAETVKTLGAALGSRFDHVDASVGAGHQFASAYHIKVAVRDGKAFWLSSGNWQSTNQNADPVDERSFDALTTLNREWHIIIENEDLAGQFENYLRYDFDNAEADHAPRPTDADDEFVVEEPEAMVERRPTGTPKYFKPLSIEREVSVQPILTPDNYADEVLALIKGAEDQILFQNQSFSLLYDRSGNDANDPCFAALADALLAKQSKPGFDLRIIMRGEFNPKTPLERMKKRGFDLSKVRLQDHCHTKGIVVDGRRVLVGSHNFTNQGTLINRDASLIFDDEDIARYFAAAFEYDWATLARASVGSAQRVRRARDDESRAPLGARIVRLGDLFS